MRDINVLKKTLASALEELARSSVLRKRILVGRAERCVETRLVRVL